MLNTKLKHFILYLSVRQKREGSGNGLDLEIQDVVSLAIEHQKLEKADSVNASQLRL